MCGISYRRLQNTKLPEQRSKQQQANHVTILFDVSGLLFSTRMPVVPALSKVPRGQWSKR
jgi:hypothetical protein